VFTPLADKEQEAFPIRDQRQTFRRPRHQKDRGGLQLRVCQLFSAIFVSVADDPLTPF
jgi:hypothetical protein